METEMATMHPKAAEEKLAEQGQNIAAAMAEWPDAKCKAMPPALAEMMRQAGVAKDRIEDKEGGLATALRRMMEGYDRAYRNARVAEHILNAAQADVRKALADRENRTGFVIN